DGRADRERLDGAWGIVDVADCVAAARHLAEAGEVDGARLAIRGGSAGGYTTLASLVFTDAFAAGASYYGVADLEALARDTHKFESRYLDRLVGPWPQEAELYRERSPIHHVDRLSTPVILLQGLEDAVVPPAQAEAMASALAPGDELALVPPVSGGATTGVVHARVTQEPLSLDRLVAMVRDARAGAVVTFAGVTREVDRLDYEAYIAMAEAELARIAGAA